MPSGAPVLRAIRSTIWPFCSSNTRTCEGYAGRYNVPAVPIGISARSAAIKAQNCFMVLWEYDIEIPPVLGRGSALRGPVRRIVQMVGNSCRPVTTHEAVIDIPLDRLAQTSSPPRGVHLPAGCE